jgi:SAM-dependent methyltransferase
MHDLSPGRTLLSLGMSSVLLWWRLNVFEPARALKRIGLYRPTPYGMVPEPVAPPSRGRCLSLKYQRPVLLEHEPDDYEDVRDFDQLAGLYEAAIRPFSDPIVDEALAYMEPHLAQGARILDPSSGPGYAALRLSELVPEGEVVAADLSRGMVEAAFDAAHQAGRENLAFFQADVAKPPCEFAGYFDALFCCLAFHHYPDAAGAVRAFRQVLAKGGTAFVADAGPEWFIQLARPISLLADPGFVRHRTGDEFLRLFEEAGFSSASWVEMLPGIGLTIARA